MNRIFSYLLPGLLLGLLISSPAAARGTGDLGLVIERASSSV